MKKFITLPFILMALAAAPAVAGDANMRSADGSKLKINCKNSGCTVRQKIKGGKWKVVEKGDGGRENFLVLEAKYKAQGFK